MSDDLCPARTGTAASHCWHDTGRWLMTYPPKNGEICCYCGVTRFLPVLGYFKTGGHGPHAPSLGPTFVTDPPA